MEFKDYYKILGVEPDAEKAAIKTAYRKLARKYHPDLNPGKESEERFKEVAEAWEVLGDDDRRAEFDELRRYGGQRAGGFEPPPGWQSRAGSSEHQFSGDFSDFFSSMFGGGFGGADHAEGFTRGRRGQDVEIEMPVFLEETLADARKPIEYEIPIIENGRRSQRRKSLNVTIPAGVGDGERIRLKGQGTPGQGGAPDGDLYLIIRLVPHPTFEVDGADLLVTVPVAPWEAALGAKVEVPTLDGKINLTVAPGSQTGRKLRVKGKGLHRNRKERGDLYAILKVVMPEGGSERAEKLWRELAGVAAFDPRSQWRKG